MRRVSIIEDFTDKTEFRCMTLQWMYLAMLDIAVTSITLTGI